MVFEILMGIIYTILVVESLSVSLILLELQGRWLSKFLKLIGKKPPETSYWRSNFQYAEEGTRPGRIYSTSISIRDETRPFRMYSRDITPPKRDWGKNGF
jgi:hypothetical protein